MKCPNCGYDLPDAAPMCSNCKTIFNRSSESTDGVEQVTLNAPQTSMVYEKTKVINPKRTRDIVIIGLTIVVAGLIILSVLKSTLFIPKYANGYDNEDDAVIAFLDAWCERDYEGMERISLCPELLAMKDMIVLNFDAASSEPSYLGDIYIPPKNYTFTDLDNIYEELCYARYDIYDHNKWTIEVKDLDYIDTSTSMDILNALRLGFLYGDDCENISNGIFLTYGFRPQITKTYVIEVYSEFNGDCPYVEYIDNPYVYAYQVNGKWYASLVPWNQILCYRQY